MRIFHKDDFLKDVDAHIEMFQHAVFVYPTDTLYGIGCDARSCALVQRIRRIKSSLRQPFSVIVPSKEWIKENLVYKPEYDKWLDKLPGPYTLIMEVKNKECVCMRDINPVNNTLGVRIPKHWIADIAKKADRPFVTTSVNIHGQQPCDSLQDVPANIGHLADFGIDEGEIKGKPSMLVDLTKSPPEIIERK